MAWGRLSKYGAVRTSGFASKLEKAVHDHLVILEKAGILKDIKCQQHVKLTAADIVYIADFSAIECATNRLIYYEAKGIQTDVWKIKLRLYRHYGQHPLRIFCGTSRRILLQEEVIPKNESAR